MVVRTWTGWTARARADEYARYMRTVALPAYTGTPGNRGVLMLRRDLEDRTEFTMVTLWRSLLDVEAFAGPDPERAVFFDRDDDFLVDRERTARHYELYGASATVEVGDLPGIGA